MSKKVHTLEEIKMHFMVLESMRLELESIKWWRFWKLPQLMSWYARFQVEVERYEGGGR